MSKRKIGVYVCHCGGNISDYVDVERVREAASHEDEVAVAKTTMFACSDAAQKEMEQDIKEKKLDGLVVASCSPKLHTMTFRGVAKRADLNPYQYVQVNIREGCSWAHREDREGATEKAIALVKAGVASAALSHPLEPIRIETVPAVVIVGAGIAGLRAAMVLSDLGIDSHVVESAKEAGGHLAQRGNLFPTGQSGKDIVEGLLERATERENVHLYLGSRVVDKSGSVGDFQVTIEDHTGEKKMLNAGSLIVATGAKSYVPGDGEFGYALDGVVTLTEFMDALDASEGGGLSVKGRDVETICYIYCVGSRQDEEQPGAHTYCSRFCCGAGMHAAVSASKLDEDIRQYHLYRDIRTYGKLETIYEEANKRGSFIIKYEREEPPVVKEGEDGLVVTVKDKLHQDETFDIEADLVVLVTGLVPRENSELQEILKIPVGTEGFFNEIHPKLRPVETVMDGIMISGCCQAPRNAVESVTSSLSAAAKSGSLLLKGYVKLEPLVAEVSMDDCVWCGKCVEACPYLAIGATNVSGKKVAAVNKAVCKGCGACVPACPEDAIDLSGYENDRIMHAIEALAGQAAGTTGGGDGGQKRDPLVLCTDANANKGDPQ